MKEMSRVPLILHPRVGRRMDQRGLPTPVLFVAGSECFSASQVMLLRGVQVNHGISGPIACNVAERGGGGRGGSAAPARVLLGFALTDLFN